MKEYWEGTNIQKPPIGVTPRYIWVEHRVHELREAIHRYLNAGLEPNGEWYKELLDHYEYLYNRKK